MTRSMLLMAYKSSVSYIIEVGLVITLVFHKVSFVLPSSYLNTLFETNNSVSENLGRVFSSTCSVFGPVHFYTQFHSRSCIRLPYMVRQLPSNVWSFE